jgi:hypothetical protein
MWVGHCQVRPFLDFNFIIQHASSRRQIIIVYRDSLCLLRTLDVVDTAQLSDEYEFEYRFTDNHRAYKAPELLRKFARADPQIRPFRFCQNLGLSKIDFDGLHGVPRRRGDPDCLLLRFSALCCNIIQSLQIATFDAEAEPTIFFKKLRSCWIAPLVYLIGWSATFTFRLRRGGGTYICSVLT